MNITRTTLRKRYKVILKDGREIPLNIKPEEKCYFENQEEGYLILCLRDLNIDIKDIKEIVNYFILEETEQEVLGL